MRVVAGRYRGRRLVAPQGTATRPTSDRVREAVFSAVISRTGGLAGCRVADLYAGSGALGLEALSRGATQCTFVDADRRAIATIRENLTALGIDAGSAVVVQAPCEAVGRRWRPGAAVSLLFADPPYRIESGEVIQVLEAMGDLGALGPGAVIVYEHAAGIQPVWPEGFAGEQPRRYGDTAVSIAVYEGRVST